MGRALNAKGAMRLVGDALGERVHQARLPDARLARDQNDLTLARLGAFPPAREDLHLLVAADQCGQMFAVDRLEAALRAAPAVDGPGADRTGEPLEVERAEIRGFEQAAGERVRRRADDDRVRCRVLLKASGEIGRFADDVGFFRRARADDVADGHGSSRHADPHREIPVEGAHRLDDSEPRVDRAFGVVLVAPGIAEIGIYPVSHELG